jgi:hypothetical protein
MFNKFLALLPEEKMSKLLNDLYNSSKFNDIDGNISIMLDTYTDEIKSKFFRFKSRAIQTHFNIFNQSFNKLFDFTGEYFFNVKNSSIIALCPELQDPLDLEKKRLLNKKDTELKSLVKNLAGKYDQLLSMFIQYTDDIEGNRNTIKGGKIKPPIKNCLIKQIEILDHSGRIKVYINGNYSQELDFSRRKYWGKMYDLAVNNMTPNDKSFYDYFNSNSKNPLISKHNFKQTQILKIKDGFIVKNIDKIGLITQKKISQRKNRA